MLCFCSPFSSLDSLGLLLFYIYAVNFSRQSKLLLLFFFNLLGLKRRRGAVRFLVKFLAMGKSWPGWLGTWKK